MRRFLAARSAARITLAALLAAAAAVVLIAPSEQTLGAGVKIVYVHVALSRAGMIGFYLAGLVGLAALVSASERLAAWMRAISWAALGLAVAGFLISGVAQMASWGGIAWDEPRVVAALQVLAAAAIAQVIAAWAPWVRVRGLAYVLLAAFQLWTAQGAANVLHPGNAISGSTSPAIQAAGVALLALALLLGAWIVWQVRRRAAPEGPSLR
jgi:hypothetical protein